MLTAKGEQTKSTIVNSAVTLFMSNHIKHVTIRDITTHAGYGKATFYSYFDSKDALVWYIIDREYHKLYTIFCSLESYGHSAKDIDRLINSLIDYVIEHKSILKLVHEARFYNYLDFNQLKDKYNNTYNPLKALYQWLYLGRSSGKLQFDDTEFIVHFIFNVIHELIDEILDESLPYSIDTLSFNLKQVLKKILEVNDVT